MHSYVLQAFLEHPWAILPQKLAVLDEIVQRHVQGERLTETEIQARIHGATRPPDRKVVSDKHVQQVAILPLFGTIFPRANLMTDMSGATSAERFGAQFSALVDDPEVGAIILDVNSPGGQINGVVEASDRIYEARGTKPVVAVANHLMASAAYWIGSASDELVVTPSAEIGSIGVLAVHQDISKALERDGIKVSIIKEGKYKAEGNPFEPLADEARGALQTRVKESYDAFVEAVARNRNVKVDDVRNGYGEGRLISAQQALRIGMADRMETLEQTVARLFQQMVGGVPVKRRGLSSESVNPTPGTESSDLQQAAELNREAQSLRERVHKILQKE
jgi:signal peptide peptidase SppA